MTSIGDRIRIIDCHFGRRWDLVGAEGIVTYVYGGSRCGSGRHDVDVKLDTRKNAIHVLRSQYEILTKCIFPK